MSTHGHSHSVQSFQTLLYRKPLHPELFNLKARRLLKHGAYELEAWVMPGGHVLRFKFGAFACTELVTDQDGRLPMEGAVTAFPCAGEHEFEHSFDAERVKFLTSVQTESLSENLYNSTYDDIVQLGKETGSLLHTWSDMPSGFLGVAAPLAGDHAAVNSYGALDGHSGGALATASPGRRNLSMVEIQRLPREAHVQGYHLIAQHGLVLRTQTIFEHK
jgi:hypothetical protein